MLILVLDSCGSSCATGLWKDGHVLAQAQEPMERGQDARLMPMILELLDQCQISFADLDRIAVTRGPGSFTGARVGLATARGLALASQKPIIGLDRFALYHALHEEKGKNILVVIESKRTELFCKYFPLTGDASEARLLTEEQIQDFLKTHPHTILVGDKATPQDTIIEVCAKLAAKADEKSKDFAATPLYLRAPDVSLGGAKSR